LLKTIKNFVRVVLLPDYQQGYGLLGLGHWQVTEPVTVKFSTNPGEPPPDNAYMPNKKQKPNTNVNVNLIIGKSLFVYLQGLKWATLPHLSRPEKSGWRATHVLFLLPRKLSYAQPDAQITRFQPRSFSR